MANDSLKRIESVKVGDMILAIDEQTKQLKPAKVKKIFKHMTNSYLVVNGSLQVTLNHPVYHGGKWVEIGDLKVGDTLLNSEGKDIKITSLTNIFHKGEVYNLEVDSYHTFVTNGIVVHNKPVISPLQ